MLLGSNAEGKSGDDECHGMWLKAIFGAPGLWIKLTNLYRGDRVHLSNKSKSIFLDLRQGVWAALGCLADTGA